MIPQIKGVKVYGVFLDNKLKAYSEDMADMFKYFEADDVREMTIDEFRKEIIKAAEKHG